MGIATLGKAVATRSRRIIARMEEWGLLRSLLCSSVAGFVTGFLARSLILLLGIVRALSRQGHGLVHVVLGMASGYGAVNKPTRRRALQLAVFFTSYELGEWPLGDPPFQELHGFSVGVLMGVVVGSLSLLYRKLNRG